MLFYFPCLEIVSESMAARLQFATLAQELVGDVFCSRTYDCLEKTSAEEGDICLEELQAEMLTFDGINQQIFVKAMLIRCQTMGSFRGQAEADARAAFASIAAELS